MRRIDDVVLEAVVVALVGVALMVAGALTGAGAVPVAAGLGAYLCWNGFQLYRFRRWVAHPKRVPAPVRIGVWDRLARDTLQIRNLGKSQKKRLRNLLGGFQESTNALPDATVVLDEYWKVEWSNPAARKLLGLSKPKDQTPLGIFECIEDRVFREYITWGDFSRPLQIPAPVDFRISLEVRVVPYGKAKHLIQARDITRINQLENVRRDFVANVSHELRTPLTVVHGYLETMLETDDDDDLDQWKPILSQMHSQSLRLQRIVDDLLTLSRLETRDGSERMEPIQICDLIDRIAGAARSLSGTARHEITVSCTPELGLCANATEIESAFSNLVFNAVRYTPDQGRIELRWWQEGEEGHFSVTDTGVGIEAKHIPRLTERFYRVDVGRSRGKGGTGLGLAIVKHVLLRHDGRLHIDSELGVGSTFTCRFPAERIRLLPVTVNADTQALSA